MTMCDTRNSFFSLMATCIFLPCLAGPLLARALPCAGVDRGNFIGDNAKLQSVIAMQLRLPSVRLIEFFKFHDWSIIYLDTSIR